MEHTHAKLFSLLKEWYKRKFWEEYWDTDIFAIQLPDQKEPFFVSITGEYGGDAGFSVFRNVKELAYYYENFAMLEEEDPFTLLLTRNCLAVDYVDREELTKEEYEMVKASGIPFRGRGAWPVLTDYQTGWTPDIPSEEEVMWLSEVMEKIIETAEDFRLRLNFYEDEENDFQYLLREYHTDGSHTDGLFDVPEEVSVGVTPELIGRSPVLVSDFELKRAKRLPLKQVTWELNLDVLNLPVVLNRGDRRSFFPSLLLVVSPYQEHIIAAETVREQDVEEIQRKIVQMIFAENMRPSAVFIREDKAIRIIAHLWELLYELGIQLKMVDNLPLMESIKKKLSEETQDDFPF